MDRLDVGMLRELARDRVISWGSLDPRLSAPDLARRLKVDPTTVRDRLRAWKRDGFLLGFSVLPSTSLLGAGLASGAIRVPDPSAKPGVLAALRAIPAVMGSMDHVGEWIGLGYVDESAAALDKLLEEVGRVPGVAEVTPPFRVPTPTCTADLTPLDWRIVAALRAHPREGLGVAAREAGVSLKTFARRYERLVAGRALWSVASYDFGAARGAFPTHVILTTAGEKAANDAARAMRSASDAWTSWHVIPPALVDGEHAMADMYFAPASSGELAALLARAAQLVGPANVEAYPLLRFELFGSWFDERIAERAGR